MKNKNTNLKLQKNIKKSASVISLGMTARTILDVLPFLFGWFPKCGPWTAASTSLRKLLEVQIFGPSSDH